MIFKMILLILVSIVFGKKLRLGVGRPPERADHILCKVQMYEKLEKINEDNDPRAIAEAYYNRTGFACKTYCRVRSAHRELAKITQEFDSPYYVLCAHDRYCSKGARCKRFSSPLKLDETKNGKESPENDSTETNSDEVITNPTKSTIKTNSALSSSKATNAVTNIIQTTIELISTTSQHATTAQIVTTVQPATITYSTTMASVATKPSFAANNPNKEHITTADLAQTNHPTRTTHNTTPNPMVPLITSKTQTFKNTASEMTEEESALPSESNPP